MPSPVYNNFQNLITFSRASNATLVDATGRITYAPSNVLAQSNDFTNATWTKTNGTATTSSVTSPIGNLFQITNTAGSASFVRCQQLASPAFGTGIISAYMAVGNTDYAFIQVAGVGGGAGNYAIFNLANGSVVGSSVGITALITPVGGSPLVYRCSIASTVANVSSGVQIGPSNGTLTANPTSNLGQFIYAGGAQFEAVTYQTTPSTYNPTTTAAYYGPRLDYDPATLALKGLLIEEARTNLATYSEQFDNAIWYKLGSAGGAVAVNQTTAPDGTNTADKFSVGTGSGIWYVANYNNYSIVSGTAYTFSVYIKAAGLNFAFVRTHNNSLNIGSSGFIVDLTTGAITYPSAGTAPQSTGTATFVGNGWWRVTATSTANATTTTTGGPGVWATNSTSFANSNGQSPANFTGDGTSGIFLWGAQLEAGSFATSYIPTVAASVARSADLASMTGSQFAPWYNRNAGTFVVQADVSFVGSGDKYVLTIDNADGRISYVSTASIRAFDGTNIVSTGQSATANVSFKAATAWGGTAMSVAANGATPVGGSYDGSWGTSLLYLGSNNTSTPINGHLQSVTYYPRTLSNSQLQSLTS